MSDGETLWCVVTTIMCIVFLVMTGLGKIHHYDLGHERCKDRGGVYERGGGVCTCRDGTSWIWEEGYTRKLGPVK